MGEIIEMRYQKGMLKPLREVKLKEGEIVKVEIKETKKVTKKFRSKLTELRDKAEKVEGAHRTLEEIRDARY